MSSKNRKTIIIISSIAVVSAIVYGIFKRSDNKKKIKLINDILDGSIKDPNSGGGQNIITKTDYESLPNGNFPLKIGSKNKKVYEIQKLLNSNYGTSIDLDGKYGEQLWNIMCEKVWSSWYTNKYLVCYEAKLSTNSPLIRRSISASDFETIKSHRG